MYRISGNIQGIYISRISLVQAQFVKYKIFLKYFTSIRKIWSPAAICEIKILEMANIQPLKITTYTVLTVQYEVFMGRADQRSSCSGGLGGLCILTLSQGGVAPVCTLPFTPATCKKMDRVDVVQGWGGGGGGGGGGRVAFREMRKYQTSKPRVLALYSRNV